MLYELALVSAVTQAAVVLPMREYFHRAAILGLAANVLVLPLAGIMLNSGIVAIALSYISMPFAHLAARIAALALHWTLACIGWLAIFTSLSGACPILLRCCVLLAAAGILLAL